MRVQSLRVQSLLALVGLVVFSCQVLGDEKADLKKQLLAKFDLNGDGKVDEAEKAKAVEEMQKQMQQQGGIPDELKKRFDSNGDGQIDAQEAALLRAAMMQLQRGGGGPPQFGPGGGFNGGGIGGLGSGGFGEAQIPPEVMKKFDKNKDGKLDDKEKTAAMEAMQGVKKSRAQQIKEKQDLDGDGKVTKEEKAAYAEQLKAEQEEKKMSKRKKKDDDK